MHTFLYLQYEISEYVVAVIDIYSRYFLLYITKNCMHLAVRESVLFLWIYLLFIVAMIPDIACLLLRTYLQ